MGVRGALSLLRFVARPGPQRNLAKWMQLGIPSRIGVLHRYPRSKFDMLAKRLWEWCVRRQPRLVSRRQVECGESLALRFVDC